MAHAAITGGDMEYLICMLIALISVDMIGRKMICGYWRGFGAKGLFNSCFGIFYTAISADCVRGVESRLWNNHLYQLGSES
jgi:hypothetical protein